MSNNINVFVSSMSDGTTRNNVPDWRIHFDVQWKDADGTPHQYSADEYFLLLINWLRINHPIVAKNLMDELAFKIARAKYAIDMAESLQ